MSFEFTRSTAADEAALLEASLSGPSSAVVSPEQFGFVVNELPRAVTVVRVDLVSWRLSRSRAGRVSTRVPVGRPLPSLPTLTGLGLVNDLAGSFMRLVALAVALASFVAVLVIFVASFIYLAVQVARVVVFTADYKLFLIGTLLFGCVCPLLRALMWFWGVVYRSLQIHSRQYDVSAHRRSLNVYNWAQAFGGGWLRKIPLSEVRFFRPAACNVVQTFEREVLSQSTSYVVEAVTLGTTVVACRCGDQAACSDIATRLNAWLTDVRSSNGISTPPPPILGVEDNGCASVPLTIASALTASLPSDAKFELCVEEDTSLTWVRRDLFQDQLFGFILFSTFWWFGCLILSVFLSEEGSLVRLVTDPFAVVGTIVSLLSCIVMSSAVDANKMWVFKNEEAHHLPLGRKPSVQNEQYNLLDVARVELCQESVKSLESLKAERISGEVTIGGERFSLRFMSTENEVFRIGPMTEGETLYLANELRKKFQYMFQQS